MSDSAWKCIEENLVHPHRLKDLIYSAIPLKRARTRFGPIITNLLAVWRYVEKESKSIQKWHKNSPLFHNYSLLSGAKPFAFSQWEEKGIHVLGDMFGDSGLFPFSDLRAVFNLPASSFFVYLQLRSSMKAYEVPWTEPLTTHKLHHILNRKKSFVTQIYNLLLIANYKPLKTCGVRIWMQQWRMTTGKEYGIVTYSLKNPNHQVLHFNFLHRTHLTPKKRYLMKLTSSPYCDKCSENVIGTFIHMFWDCKYVNIF
ncbi:hypothetical protein NQD34_001308 [Periophthalmus magnuspinnatus]|nr:hypothetical protein NQD34_001308 [Periophthalmus magnuspinnatus]